MNDTSRALPPLPENAAAVALLQGAKRTRPVARTRFALPVLLAVKT